MKLSIIVPVYNEEKTIIQILKKVNDMNLKLDKEIIVVNDGSNDKTIEKLTKNPELYTKLITKQNEGKGSALREGFKLATGDIILIQDADLEYDPNDYPRLVEPIQNGEKVVYGSRYSSLRGNLKNNSHLIYYFHFLGNTFLSLVTSILYGHWLRDMETCYKVFNKEVIKDMDLVSNDFRIEPELTAKILKRGYKIKEIPIEYYSRDYNEGKKITWYDGYLALMTLIKYRFVK